MKEKKQAEIKNRVSPLVVKKAKNKRSYVCASSWLSDKQYIAIDSHRPACGKRNPRHTEDAPSRQKQVVETTKNKCINSRRQ